MLRRRLVLSAASTGTHGLKYCKVVETCCKSDTVAGTLPGKWSDNFAVRLQKHRAASTIQRMVRSEQQDRFFAVRKQESVGTNAGF